MYYTTQRIKSVLRLDVAENSIMQTITIAVSAILIAAGLMTAPGLINNARDNNATSDLSNLAEAQESALSNVGSYATIVNPASTDVTSLPKTSLLKYNLSGGTSGTEAVTCGGSYFVLAETSASGKTFYRDSTSGKTVTDVNDLTIPPCADAILTSSPSAGPSAGTLCWVGGGDAAPVQTVNGVSVIANCLDYAVNNGSGGFSSLAGVQEADVTAGYNAYNACPVETIHYDYSGD
jgi:type II secretory pathway pseudopilin PulG